MVMKYVFDLKAITDTEAVCQPYKKKKKNPNQNQTKQTNQPTNQKIKPNKKNYHRIVE